MSDSIHVLAHVQREIEKAIQEQNTFLASGRAGSFDEYQKICGVIRGLSLASSYINDLVQKLERE